MYGCRSAESPNKINRYIFEKTRCEIAYHKKTAKVLIKVTVNDRAVKSENLTKQMCKRVQKASAA